MAFKIGGAIGGLWERNKRDIAKYGGLAANFIPGVGPLAAAGISAGLNYGANKNIGQALGAGIGSYGLGKLAGKLPGAQRVTDLINRVPGGSALASAAGNRLQGALQGQPQGIQGLLGQAGNFLTGNGGMNALGLAQGANAAFLGQKSSNFADMAAKNVDDAYNAKAPLRAQGLAGMMNPQIADTSALQRISARGNPFADRPQPVRQGGV